MSKSYIADGKQGYDARWAGPHGDYLIEVKRTSNARDVRGALLGLAFGLKNEAEATQGVLVLTDSKLSSDRLEGELAQFRSIVKDEVGRKLHLIAFDDERLQGHLPHLNEDFALFIRDLVLHEAATQGGRASRVYVQSLVVDSWLQSAPMTSSLEVIERSKASKPTVLAALENLLKIGVISGSYGNFFTHAPSLDAWAVLAKELQSERKAVRFADPSGLGRSPTALLERFIKIKHRGTFKLDVGLSGVVGAMHSFPGLNITAPPRLDLSVYNGDTSFVRQLDAGLVEVKASSAHGPLVLHLGRRLRRPSLFDSADFDHASPLECLADLQDLGLMAEAEDFAHHLNTMVSQGRSFQ